jgi:tripartite-type tricarboxylate transporter receptor subunit TctC
MPRPLVQQINADLQKAVSSPETAKRLNDAGIELAPGSADQFSSFVKAEVVKWAKVIKEAGISAD